MRIIVAALANFVRMLIEKKEYSLYISGKMRNVPNKKPWTAEK
jgi:uncharacterized short protein YbdD (DUF466 family)